MSADPEVTREITPVYANGRARRGSYQRPANVHLSDKAACARWTA